jgi:hypothetical protein
VWQPQLDVHALWKRVRPGSHRLQVRPWAMSQIAQPPSPFASHISLSPFAPASSTEQTSRAQAGAGAPGLQAVQAQGGRPGLARLDEGSAVIPPHLI